MKAIKSGKYKRDIEMIRKGGDKRYLTGFTPSGTFSKRFDDNIEKYSGIICIDFDGDGGKVKKRMDEHTKYAFLSPNGGLKILVEVDTEQKYHKTAYHQVCEHYGIEGDRKCTNLSRLCFVSYDPDMFEGEGVVFNVDTSRHEEVEDVSFDIPEVINTNGLDITEKAWRIASKKYPAHKGNRNNCLHYYACICNRAGVDTDNTISGGLRHVPSLGGKEVYNTVKNVYRRNAGEFGAKPFKGKTKQKGLWSG